MKVWLVTKEICLANFSGKQFYLLSSSMQLAQVLFPYQPNVHINCVTTLAACHVIIALPQQKSAEQKFSASQIFGISPRLYMYTQSVIIIYPDAVCMKSPIPRWGTEIVLCHKNMIHLWEDIVSANKSLRINPPKTRGGRRVHRVQGSSVRKWLPPPPALRPPPPPPCNVSKNLVLAEIVNYGFKDVHYMYIIQPLRTYKIVIRFRFCTSYKSCSTMAHARCILSFYDLGLACMYSE